MINIVCLTIEQYFLSKRPQVDKMARKVGQPRIFEGWTAENVPCNFLAARVYHGFVFSQRILFSGQKSINIYLYFYRLMIAPLGVAFPS